MKIASLVIFDDTKSQICARRFDVKIPSEWDAERVIQEACRYLPSRMALTHDDPLLIRFYPMDDDPVNADWTQPIAGEQGMLFL